MKYCIDTSALMDAWVRWYPRSVFPSLWIKMDELLVAGELVSSEEVYQELERKEDELFAWAKGRKQAFQPLTKDIQDRVKAILQKFPKLVDARTGKSFADPFVIATSQVLATCVVTGESPTGKASRPKIPDVCGHYGISCIGMVEMIRMKGWSF